MSLPAERASPGVYFPQTCSHITHSLNIRGELRTALITGNDRLVLLKQGECVGECAIRLHRSTTTTTSSISGEAGRVQCVTICPCAHDVIRVVVATTAGLQLVEMADTDSAGAHSYNDDNDVMQNSNNTVKGAPPVSASSRATTSAAHYNTTSSSSGNTNVQRQSSTYKASVPSTSNVAHWSTMHGTALSRSRQPSGMTSKAERYDTSAQDMQEEEDSSNAGICHRFINVLSPQPHTPLQADDKSNNTNTRSEVVTMAFMTAHTLCIVYRTEAVLVALHHHHHDTNSINGSNNSIAHDVVLWRTAGQYTSLSICPIHHHIALGASDRHIRVFTCHGNNKELQHEQQTMRKNACAGLGIVGECATAALSEESSSAVTSGSPVLGAMSDALRALPQPRDAHGVDRDLTRASNSAANLTRAAEKVEEGEAEKGVPVPHGSATLFTSRPLLASTGLYDIVKMEWQRVATHSLLCVSCRSGPDGEAECVLLYAVQKVPSVMAFSNVVVHADLSEAYTAELQSRPAITTTTSTSNSKSGGGVQLIPCGIIPLHYGLPEVSHSHAVLPRSRSVAESSSAHGIDAWNGAALPSVAQMHTGLVPSFTACPTSLATRGQTLQFLHVEGDGTVRTSSYQIGSRKHASFAKQRAVGMVCLKLLAPLWQCYGPLREMQLLPVWLSRTLEVGNSSSNNNNKGSTANTHTSSAAVHNDSELGSFVNGYTAAMANTMSTTHALASSRRYRLVGHFANGVRALVMVDLVAELFRVEAFLTCGPRRVLSMCAIGSHTQAHEQASTGSARGDDALCTREAGEDGNVLDSLRLTGTRLTAALLAPCTTPSPQPPCTPGTLYEVQERERSNSYSAACSHTAANGWLCGASVTQTSAQAATHAMAVALFSEHYNNNGGRRRTQLLAVVPLDFAALAGQDTADGHSDTNSTTVYEASHGIRHAVYDYRLLGAWVTHEGIVLRLGRHDTCLAAAQQRAAHTIHDVVYSVRLSCVSVDSLGALEGRLVVGGVCVPALLQAQLLPRHTHTGAGVCEGQTYGRVVCDSEGYAVMLHSPLLPHDGACLRLATYCPAACTLVRVREVQSVLCVNQDVCVGVLVELAANDAAHDGTQSELWLFGYGVVQSMSAAALGFVREHVIARVHSFCLGPRGEVMTLTSDDSNDEDSLRLTRWLRCFPAPLEESATAGHDEATAHTRYCCYYVQERSWQGLLDNDQSNTDGDVRGVPACLTADLVLPCTTSPTAASAAASVMLYASTACDYLRVQPLPFQLAPHVPHMVTEAHKAKDEHENSCTPREQALLTYWQTLLSLQQEQPQHERTTAVGGAQAEPEARSRPGSAAGAVVVQYHTDVVMQLIGMGQWSVLHRLLQHVADAARALLEEDDNDDGGDGAKTQGDVPYYVRARLFVHRLCTASRTAAPLMGSDGGGSGVGGYATRLLAPSPIALHAWPEEEEEGEEEGGGGISKSAKGAALPVTTNAGMAEVFGRGALLQDLLRLLPHVTLIGLSRTQQLGLLCVLEALRQAADFARSVDEAAARYLLYHRLRALRRRLQLPDYREVPSTSAQKVAAVLSVMNFAEGDVASRTTSTAHYLWAALSDSQSALLARLFSAPAEDGAHGLAGSAITDSTTRSTTASSSSSSSSAMLTWAQVEMSGAPYWVHSTQELRTLAERVARTQYATSHSITEAALMLILARRVSTLAALCKAQNNTKLHGFFLRNFAADEHHRRAAAANAFAAVGKNMPQYAAAFFVLAGEVRSAAQVILQRQGSPALALFVLRAGREAAPYGTEPGSEGRDAARLRAEDLAWFVAQWQASASEADEGGVRDEGRSTTPLLHGPTLWLRACMAWLSGQVSERVHALGQLAAHPTGLPEVLCTLRYARDSVITVAHRHGEFLSSARELVCVMRLGRFCLARGLYLNAELHYAEAELLLRRWLEQAQQEQTSSKGIQGPSSATALLQPFARQGAAHAHMQADVATGTLVFHGFDSDSEGEAETEAQHPVTREEEHLGAAAAAALVQDTEAEKEDAAPSQLVVAALRREMAQARARMQRYDQLLQPLVTTSTSHEVWNDDETHLVALDADLFAFCSALLLALDRQSDLQGWLTGLLTHLQPAMDAVRWQECGEPDEAGKAEASSAAVCDTHRLFVLVLQLVLSTVAARVHHYSLARALLRLQAMPAERLMQCVRPVSGADSAGACMHPVVAFLVGLQYYMQADTQAEAEEGAMAEGKNEASMSRAHVAASSSASPASPRSAHALLLSTFGKPPGLEDSDDSEEEANATGSARQTQEEEETTGDAPQHRSMWDTLRAATEAETRSAARERGALLHNGQAACEADCSLCLSSEAATSMLFTWFTLRVSWTALCRLYAMASTMLATHEHNNSNSRGGEANDNDCFARQHGLAARLLLCHALLLVHDRFAGRTERVITRYAAGLTHCEECLACNPNGLFLEADRVCRAVRATLAATLAMCAMEVPGGVWQGRGGQARGNTRSEACTSLFYAGGNKGSLSVAPQHAEDTTKGSDVPACPSWLLLELCIAHIDLYGQPRRLAGSSTPHVLLLLRPRLLLEGILRQTGSQGVGAELVRLLVEWQDTGNDRRDDDDDEAGSNVRCSPVSDGTSAQATMRRVMSEAALLRGSSGSSVLQRSTEKLLALNEGTAGSALAGRSSTSASPLVRNAGDDMAGDALRMLYANELLYVLERTWLRRHHTHLSLRCVLLRLALRGGLQAGPLPVDRMLLHQSGHAVRTVGFDHSSGDSLVWSSEAGTMVSHGFREMLAGDHEQALQRLAPERNIATAVFSQGLAQQQQQHDNSSGGVSFSNANRFSVMPEAGTGTTSNNSPQSPRRPRMAMAISARPAPHPHLPFFLTSQRDGRVDLYPFASTECVASYLCPGGAAPITTVAYSLDGYSFCVALHDGSLAGWAFTAANFENAPSFHFAGLFVHAGLRAVMYCGDRSSMVVAVGLVQEPHNAAQDADALSAEGTTISSRAGVRGALYTSAAGQSVPEILVIDTVVQPGAVLVRCALPFLPDYAAYLPALDAVLCVSSEGFIACYEVKRGQLTILGDVALDELLASVAEGTVAPVPLVGSPLTRDSTSVLASPFQAASSPRAQRATPGRALLQPVDTERLSGRTSSSSSSRHPHHRKSGAAAAVMVTSLAVSAYDPLVALGTSHGHALLLTMEQLVQALAARKTWAATMGEESYEYHVMRGSHYDAGDMVSSGRTDKAGALASAQLAAGGATRSAFAAARQNYSILYQAAQVQVAPLLTSYAAIEDIAFSPSVLLAGLRDGKVMAVSLISQALRQLVTR